jgi:hypothetical protein
MKKSFKFYSTIAFLAVITGGTVAWKNSVAAHAGAAGLGVQ